MKNVKLVLNISTPAFQKDILAIFAPRVNRIYKS